MFRTLLSTDIKIDFRPEGFVEQLGHLVEGMICIFIVIGVIILITTLLNKAMNKKK